VGKFKWESKTEISDLLFTKLKLAPPPNPDKTK
jgi:hypothetical protein